MYHQKMRSRNQPHRDILVLLAVIVLQWVPLRSSVAASASVKPGTTQPITFNLNFEGASLGQIERIDEQTFRCHVKGQQDERGRNRQASWYFFRLDHVAGRDVTITLTDFVGEYHNRLGACPMGPDLIPVFSHDGKTWNHFHDMAWDSAKKEATLKFHSDIETIWIAHIPPYTTGNLSRLLNELGNSPTPIIETIGKTVQGRDIPLITVTNPDVPDDGKKTVWLQARQHAWEAGTSYVMEGGAPVHHVR